MPANRWLKLKNLCIHSKDAGILGSALKEKVKKFDQIFCAENIVDQPIFP